MKKVLFIILAIASFFSHEAKGAYSFVYEYEGRSLIYTVINANEKTVEYSNNDTSISGDVILPAHPVNGDTEYTLVKIGDSAFKDCTGLTSIMIPETVNTIGESAFKKCTSLEFIKLPEAVKIIEVATFNCCYSLGKIEFSNSLTKIDFSAFMSCHSLKSIKIPDTVETIRSGAFYRCYSMEHVELSKSIKKIEDETFQDCTSLTSINIPDAVTEICDNAFAGCSSLADISLPNSLININTGVFFNCSSLQTITIPSSVKYIFPHAFAGCTSLKSINVEESNDRYASHDGILYEKREYINSSTCLNLLCCPGGKTSVVFPDDLRINRVDDYAFENCSNLIDITIPESMAWIESHAFIDCTSLSSLDLPGNIIRIGDNAFEGCSSLLSVKFIKARRIGREAFKNCSSLTTLTLPDYEELGWCAFEGCSSIKSVFYPVLEPKIAADKVFDVSVYRNATLYLPEEAIAKCLEISPWKNFKNIEPYDFGLGAGEMSVGCDSDNAVGIYTLGGVKVSETLENLEPGIYVRKTSGKTEKILIGN